MSVLRTMTYAAEEGIARITLDRPERGNGITRRLVEELEWCVERADLDPEVRVIALAGNGTGFCGGYDLVDSAEEGFGGRAPADALTGDGAPGSTGPGGAAVGDDAAVIAIGPPEADPPPGSPVHPATMAANHDPSRPWDPMVDHQMMRRNVRGFMSLLRADTPVVCTVHGYCVAGGTDLALCSDLLVIASDAKIGYPPARVWGSPTTALWAHRIGAQRAKRLLFTGDCLTGAEALDWGLAIDAPPPEDLDARSEDLLRRIARMPLNQLVAMKLLVNQSVLRDLDGVQTVGTLLDGATRHTPEGHAFQERAVEAGFRTAVAERDGPFGDVGLRGFGLRGTGGT